MKRFNKILSIALALLTVLPMFAFSPLTANAAEEKHTAYSNMIDFEGAEAGTLTEAYVQGQLARGFSATSTASDMQKPELRALSQWTVAEEQKHDGTGYVSAGNGNRVIRQTTPGKFPLFTIWDNTGVLLTQPFEFSFDIFARSGSTGGSSGLVHFTNTETFVSTNRMNLLGVTNGTPAPVTKGDGNFGTTLGRMTVNAWTSVRIQVYPTTGRVITWVNGQQVNDSTFANLVGLSSANSKKAGIAIGWNYGLTFDFDLDNISLRSLEETATVREHVDFTGYNIDAIPGMPAVPGTTTTESLAAYLSRATSSATSIRFANIASSDSVRDTYFSIVEDSGDDVLKHVVSKNVGNAGVRVGNANLVKSKHEISFQIKYVGHGTNPLNTIRYGKGETSGAFAPLVLLKGRSTGTEGNLYACTIVDGYALLQKTDAGYQPIVIEPGKWYDFKVITDPTAKTYQVFMKTPADGDWQTLRFVKDAPKTNAWLAGTLTEEQTVDTAQLSWFGSSFTNVDCVWLAHGTGNAWTSKTEFYLDDISAKTVDGTTVNELLDFEREIVTTEGTPATPDQPANTDWWVNESFKNANSKKGSLKLTDWQIVDAPASASTYGKVIQPKANLGAFCFDDTDDILSQNVFDVSFDFYMTNKPDSNIHLLKLWAPYSAADASADATLSTIVLMHNKLYAYDENYASTSDKRRDLKITINNNTWYNFRVRFEIPNDQYSVYLNGRKIYTQSITGAYPNGIKIDKLESLHFEIHNHYNSTVKAYHFLDNIRVESVDVIQREVGSFENYELLNADFEDAAWLTALENGEIPFVSADYTRATILSDAGLVGNNALCLTGTVGGALEVDLGGFGGFHNTVAIEMSVSYGNVHGSALDLVVLEDVNLTDSKTLLSVMGNNTKDELTGTLFFNDDGNRYYLCNSAGNLYYAGNGNAEATTFIDVAFILDAASGSYAIYVGGKPAYFKQYGKAEGLTRASDISLGLKDNKTAFKSPSLSLIECSADTGTDNRLLVDDLRVSSVKNGLTPVLVGYQENTTSGTAIRFLATVDTLYYEEMGFIVEAKDITKTFSTTTVFTSITANGGEVIAKDLDGRYITALVISDIDEASVEFTVTPYVTFFGETILGESRVYTYTAE